MATEKDILRLSGWEKIRNILFIIWRKKSSEWNFSRECWFILNQFIKTKLRNGLCKNKEDKIFFLNRYFCVKYEILIIEIRIYFYYKYPNLSIFINNVLELSIVYSVDQIDCWLTWTLKWRRAARWGAISRLLSISRPFTYIRYDIVLNGGLIVNYK